MVVPLAYWNPCEGTCCTSMSHRGTSKKQRLAAALWPRHNRSGNSRLYCSRLGPRGRSQKPALGRKRRGVAVRKGSQAGKRGRIRDKRARIDFCNQLMTSSSLSGDCSFSLSSTPGTFFCMTESLSFQPAVTLSHPDLICHHFHQIGNTSFFNLLNRIGFWDFRILSSPLLEKLNHNFACCWHCSFFHESWGSHPWLFFFLGPWVPSLPGCFSFFTSIWHVFHQTHNSPLAYFIVGSGEPCAHSWLTASLSTFSPSPVSVSCSKHTLVDASLALL